MLSTLNFCICSLYNLLKPGRKLFIYNQEGHFIYISTFNGPTEYIILPNKLYQ